MNIDIILGIIMLIGALTIITILVFWSTKTIDKIANTNNHALSDIKEEERDNG